MEESDLFYYLLTKLEVNYSNKGSEKNIGMTKHMKPTSPKIYLKLIPLKTLCIPLFLYFFFTGLRVTTACS